MSFEVAAWIVGVISTVLISVFILNAIAYFISRESLLQLPGHWFLVAVNWLTKGDIEFAREHVRRFQYEGIHRLLEATA